MVDVAWGCVARDQKVDPRRLIDLKVDDETFVEAVYRILKPGGFFMIYNLHPAPAKTGMPYIPWADGRCPFDRQLLTGTGFDVIEFDAGDTEFIRTMGKTLGWDSQMDLESDLFATYTLLRKPIDN